jgi:hypothetical protein
MTSESVPSNVPKLRMSRSQRKERAVEVGPVELMALLEWELRHRPRALRNIRMKYTQSCLRLYVRLEKARCGQ